MTQRPGITWIDLQGRAARHRVVQEVLLEEQAAERGAPLPEGPPHGGRGWPEFEKVNSELN